MSIFWYLEKIRPNDKLTSETICFVLWTSEILYIVFKLKKKQQEDHLQILSLYAPSDNSPAIELDGESPFYCAIIVRSGLQLFSQK